MQSTSVDIVYLQGIDAWCVEMGVCGWVGGEGGVAYSCGLFDGVKNVTVHLLSYFNQLHTRESVRVCVRERKREREGERKRERGEERE